MNPKYQKLFEPLTLNNGQTLKNRLAVAPMTHFGSNADGSISEQERAFLQGRAQDFGLFITAATLVHPSGKAFIGQPEATSERCLNSLRETADIIKNQGAKAVLQIHHGGKLSRADLNGGTILAPSDDAESNARALTDAEIRELIAALPKRQTLPSAQASTA